MRHLEGTPRHQSSLLPPQIEDNGAAIKKACRHFIVFCRQAGLVSGQLVAIDGSKFKAAASKDQAITRKQLEKQISKLNAKIDGYLARLDASEQESEAELDTSKVIEALAYLQSHRKQIQDELMGMVDAGKTQICRTEPDAKLMRSGREGMVVGYNAQNAVDAQHQLIVHHELTQSSTDNDQLEPIATATREVLGDQLQTVVADAGYSNGAQGERNS